MKKIGYVWLILGVLCAHAVPVHAFKPSDAPKTLGVGTADDLREQINKALAELPEPEDNETISDYVRRANNAVFGAIDGYKGETKEALDQMDEVTPLVVSAKTTAGATPDGFPERVREGIADFLPALGLSMDAVSTSDDRRTVTLKLPSWKFQFGAVNMTAAATEPAPFKSLVDKIVEPAREDQTKAIQAKIQDYDDLTYALSFGYRIKGKSWAESRHLYGRDANDYKPLVDELATAIWSRVEKQTEALSLQAGDITTNFLVGLRMKRDSVTDEEVKKLGVFDIPFGVIRSWSAAGDLGFKADDLVASLKESARKLAEVDIGLKSEEIDALPSLIDNQPQIVLTLSRREPNELVGTPGTTLSARYEMGFNNLNAVLRKYRDAIKPGDDAKAMDEAKLTAIRDVVQDGQALSENKLILSVTHKWVDDYSLTYPYKQTLELDPETGKPSKEAERTAILNLDKSREFSGNLSYTRFLQSGKGADNQTGVLLPRMTLTVEKIWVQDNPTRQNRTVAKLSYVQPATSGLSVPITITWADHAEFLGQQDKTFGAHLGVSFKMNR